MGACRLARVGGFILLTLLAACSSLPRVPYSLPPAIGLAYPEKLGITEPLQGEVVIVVNNNIKMVHAGMFVGSALLDPAGSYLQTRREQAGWPGTSLQDYVRFQLEDGPEVRVYRFSLAPASVIAIRTRVESAGRTAPLFCAAKVQNIISGIAPFEHVPSAWLITPATVGQHLDLLIAQDPQSGQCNWPDGSSCYAAGKIRSTSFE